MAITCGGTCGRAADHRGHTDRVLERLPDEDDRAGDPGAPYCTTSPFPVSVGDHAAGLDRRRDRRAAGKAHAQRLGDRVHRRGRAIVFQWPIDGEADDTMSVLVLADLAGRELLAHLVEDGAGAHPPTRNQPLSIGAPDQRDHREMTDGGLTSGADRVVLSPARGEHRRRRGDSRRVPLDQGQGGEVAVPARRSAAAGLLDGVDRGLGGDAAASRIPSRSARPLEVIAIPRREVLPGLRDADDRLAGVQLARG